MAKDNKTLLDGLLEAGSEERGQSLEEMLGMAESEEERDKRLLLAAADQENQDAILLVAEFYMYGKHSFPKEPLEGMFWLSQSTSDRAPLVLAEYLKVDKDNLELAEQGLELLFDPNGNEKRNQLAYTFAMSLGSEFGRRQDIPRCLKWLKRANGHVDEALMETLFEWIYKNILKFPETYGEYCKEAAEYLENRVEFSKDKKKVVYWGTKSSENVSAIPQKVLTSEDGKRMLEELKKANSTVLHIPEGYTDIEEMAFDYLNHPYIKKVTEIVISDTVSVIEDSAFRGCCSLTKVKLPKRLEKLGPTPFDGTYLGFLKMWKKPKNTIQRLSIPANTKLGHICLGGIANIECLNFEYGREELDLNIFSDLFQKCKVGEMHIPGSVKRLRDSTDFGASVYIEKLHVPKHLKEDLSKILAESKGTKIGTIVHM